MEMAEGLFNDCSEPLAGIEQVIDDLVSGGCRRRIGLEFECGECCKKVTNGSEIDFKFNLVILKADEDELLHLKVFSDGKLVDEQWLKAIVVPKDRVCAIETESRKKDDPPCTKSSE